MASAVKLGVLAMRAPLSIRLDDNVRDTLEKEALARNVGLATYLRELASDRARQLRRERIQRQSAEVGAHVEASVDAAEFYADWGKSCATKAYGSNSILPALH